MKSVKDRLVERYGTPSLGNFRSPVKEIFYIVLSSRTTEPLYKAAFKSLMQQFPSLDSIAAARIADLHQCIATAGLGAKRARQVKLIASRLLEDHGRQPAAKLRRLSAADAYSYLMSLPGVGPKSALCVMMYSLDFDVFPVDVHARRVLSRVGLIPIGSKHYRAQESLPGFVPPNCSKELHVALVVHGRRVCTPRMPKCNSCCIREFCAFASTAH